MGGMGVEEMYINSFIESNDEGFKVRDGKGMLFIVIFVLFSVNFVEEYVVSINEGREFIDLVLKE